MKTALEPYVIEFLRSRGYRYFLSPAFAGNGPSTGILLKPCKVKPIQTTPIIGSYTRIEQREYVINNRGRREWMWVSIPEEEVANLRKWQMTHYALLQQKTA